MPWDIRSEAAKKRIIAFGIVLVLMLVAVLFALAFFGMEFIENALRQGFFLSQPDAFPIGFLFIAFGIPRQT